MADKEKRRRPIYKKVLSILELIQHKNLFYIIYFGSLPELFDAHDIQVNEVLHNNVYFCIWIMSVL